LSPSTALCYAPIKDPNVLITNTSVYPAIVVGDDDAGPSSNIHLPNTLPAPYLPELIPKPLVAVPLRKQIFVSRLHPNTSIDDVKAYVQSKITNALITVDKFKFSFSRDISSFKLNVPPELLQLFVVKNFVVKHFDLLIKELTPHKRIRPTVTLPINLSTFQSSNPSKN